MKPAENLPLMPDLVGPAGRAWRYDLEEIARKRGNKSHAGLVSWLIEAPGAHPFWHSYALHLFHLRDVPGLGPPKIYVPGATHEIALFALDPDKPRDVREKGEWLFPANFAAQMAVVPPDLADAEKDSAAIARINDTVREVVEGRLSPDTDHLQSWIMRYGSGMVKGDPRTAGETRIVLTQEGKEITSVIHPPAPPRGPNS